MAARIKVQPVTPVALPPLVAMAEQILANVPGLADPVPPSGPAEASALAEDLAHLARHDADGFLIATRDNDVLGFVVSFVRSRQLVLSQLWLVPELADAAVAHALVKRAVAFGARSGVNDIVAHALTGPQAQAVFFRHGLRPRFPVYRLRLPQERAQSVGLHLSRLLPGYELSEDEVTRRSGTGETERIDRLVRGVGRSMDHDYWLRTRRLRLAMVREGRRVAGYAFGGANQCGPVAATTGEAALASLGWALQFAAEAGGAVSVYVPATFENAIETLLDAGAECLAQTLWMSQTATSGMERYVLGGLTLF